MSMIPFFPSLKPQIANCIWFEVDCPCNEEAEVLLLEREQHDMLNAISNESADIHPLGKVLTIAGPETDDEDANEDSDDSDSHDEEDEDEIDRIIAANTERVRMDTSYSPAEANTPSNDDIQTQSS